MFSKVEQQDCTKSFYDCLEKIILLAINKLSYSFRQFSLQVRSTSNKPKAYAKDELVVTHISAYPHD